MGVKIYCNASVIQGICYVAIQQSSHTMSSQSDQQDQSYKEIMITKALQRKYSQKLNGPKVIALKVINVLFRALKSFLLYVPRLFCSKRPPFNQRFAKRSIYTIISEEGVAQSAQISKEFHLPLLIILVSEEQSNQTIENILLDYEISQFLNQSFVVCGLFDTQIEFKEFRNKVQQSEVKFDGPGFYFTRTTVLDELQCFGKIDLDEKTDKLVERMLPFRKQHHTRQHLEEQIMAELESNRLI